MTPPWPARPPGRPGTSGPGPCVRRARRRSRLWLAALAARPGWPPGSPPCSRGARPSLRALLIAAGLAVAALTVLPPAGSTDAFDYASYGRIVALGHSPYVMTPYHLRLATTVLPVGAHHLAARRERLRAARHGRAVPGGQARRHLRGAGRVLAEAVELDRVRRGRDRRRPAAALRPGPAAARHLLWTVNPLLLWDLSRPGTSTCSPLPRPGGLVVLGEQRMTGTSGRPERRRAAAWPPGR